MVRYEDQSSCAIVHDRGGFGLAEDGEGALEVGATVAAIAAGQVELEIIIRGSDISKHFTGALRERRPAEIGVNDDASAVDHRLNPARAKFLDRGADKIDNRVELRDFAESTELGQFLADEIDNQRSG